MEDELTSVARHCPFNEVWKTDLTGVGLRGGILFPFSVRMKQWGPVRGRHDRGLAHSKPGRSISDLSYLCLPEAQTKIPTSLYFSLPARERAEVKVNKPVCNGSRTFNISHYSNKRGPSYTLPPTPPNKILPK